MRARCTGKHSTQKHDWLCKRRITKWPMSVHHSGTYDTLVPTNVSHNGTYNSHWATSDCHRGTWKGHHAYRCDIPRIVPNKINQSSTEYYWYKSPSDWMLQQHFVWSGRRFYIRRRSYHLYQYTICFWDKVWTKPPSMVNRDSMDDSCWQRTFEVTPAISSWSSVVHTSLSPSLRRNGSSRTGAQFTPVNTRSSSSSTEGGILRVVGLVSPLEALVVLKRSGSSPIKWTRRRYRGRIGF